MNEQTAITTQTAPAMLDQKVALGLAAAMQDQRFATLMAKGAQLAVYQRFAKIENQAQYDQAIDAFDEAKKAIKDLEDFRHDLVDYPTKLVSMINATIKQVRDGMEAAKSHLSGLIAIKRSADTAAAARATEQAAEQAANGEPMVGPEGQVQVGPATVAPPSNVVESAKGAKVHGRMSTEVSITDVKAFLKIVTGANKRYAWLQEHLDELVEIKIGVLKRLITAKPGKAIKTLPGVTIESVEKVV